MLNIIKYLKNALTMKMPILVGASLPVTAAPLNYF
jgi:hypothetical protein